MLSIFWAKKYTDYLENGQNFPGEICNNHLINIQVQNERINEPQVDVDFVLISKNSWVFIHNIYGGGP